MAKPIPPDLTDPSGDAFVVGFEPASYWQPGTFDPAALVDALKQQAPLADFDDDAGNRQSAVRLDVDADPANVGYWISVPANIDKAVVAAAVAAYEPPAPPSDLATSTDAAAATAEIITGNLVASGVKRDAIEPTFQQLLAQAQAAIPYYEGLTLKPDPKTAWVNFQALDQATKDRILFNCCRAIANMVRYMSGDLPAA